MEIYQKEYLRKIEDEYKKLDYFAWRNGSYMVSAIQVALNPKKIKYPEQPYYMQQEEKDEIPQELQAEIQAKKFEEWANTFNKRFQ